MAAMAPYISRAESDQAPVDGEPFERHVPSSVPEPDAAPFACPGISVPG
jgi:hypothetical protein